MGGREGRSLWLPGHCRYAITKSLAQPDSNFNRFQMDGCKVSGWLFKRTTSCARYVQKLMALKLAIAPLVRTSEQHIADDNVWTQETAGRTHAVVFVHVKGAP